MRPGRRGRRGRRAAGLAGICAVLALAAATFHYRDRLLEPWYIHRLASAGDADRRMLVEKLTAMGSARAAPVLLSWITSESAPALIVWHTWEVPESLRYVREALLAPGMAAGLARVVGDAQQPPQLRGHAIALLREQGHPLEAVERGLLSCLGDPAPPLRLEAALALGTCLLDDPRHALREIDRRLGLEAAGATRTALAAASLLLCAQLPEAEQAGRTAPATQALLALEPPVYLGSALGELQKRHGRETRPEKRALLAVLDTRLTRLLHSLAQAGGPAVNELACQAASTLGASADFVASP